MSLPEIFPNRNDAVIPIPLLREFSRGTAPEEWPLPASAWAGNVHTAHKMWARASRSVQGNHNRRRGRSAPPRPPSRAKLGRNLKERQALYALQSRAKSRDLLSPPHCHRPQEARTPTERSTRKPASRGLSKGGLLTWVGIIHISQLCYPYGTDHRERMTCGNDLRSGGTCCCL